MRKVFSQEVDKFHYLTDFDMPRGEGDKVRIRVLLTSDTLRFYLEA